MLKKEQPNFEKEGEVRDPENMTEGLLYTVFNRDHDDRRNFELITFPSTPIDEENDRTMDVEMRYEESENREDHMNDKFLTDCGLIPYKNGWNSVNAVVEVADGKVYSAENISNREIEELNDVDRIEAIVPKDEGAEVYTVMPGDTEAFAEENDISINRRGYFNSDELTIRPFDIDDAFDMLDDKTSSENIKNEYVSQRNQRINNAIQTLSGGRIQNPLNTETEYEGISELDDIQDVSLEDYEIFSERLGTEVSDECARNNLENSTKAFKQDIDEVGTAFYGVSRRSGQIRVDTYLAAQEIPDFDGNKTVDGRQIDVDILYEEN